MLNVVFSVNKDLIAYLQTLQEKKNEVPFITIFEDKEEAKNKGKINNKINLCDVFRLPFIRY